MTEILLRVRVIPAIKGTNESGERTFYTPEECTAALLDQWRTGQRFNAKCSVRSVEVIEARNPGTKAMLEELTGPNPPICGGEAK